MEISLNWYRRLVQDFEAHAKSVAVILDLMVEPVDDHCPMVRGRKDEGDLADWRDGPIRHQVTSRHPDAVRRRTRLPGGWHG